MSDLLLALWLLLSVIWDFAVFGVCTYLVFWKEQSGAWYILAIFLCQGYSLYKALKKRYAIEESEES